MAYCVRSRESTLEQYMHFFSEQSTCEQGKKNSWAFFSHSGSADFEGYVAGENFLIEGKDIC